MNEFRKPIFWGAGEKSGSDAWHLTQQFFRAMSLQGGLQQPDHPTNEVHARTCKQEREDSEYELERLTRSIVIALGQEKILGGAWDD